MSDLKMGPAWRVSSKSNGSNCIEVRADRTAVLVRDTKNRSQGLLSFSTAAWEDFIKTVQTDNISCK
jgi:hypothetical protein